MSKIRTGSPVKAHLASEDPEFLSREKRAMPLDKLTGKPQEWPKPVDPEREGGLKKGAANDK